MNYYDEEITISGSADGKHLSRVPMERQSSRASGGAATRAEGRQRKMQMQGSSADDDGLLQDIIDHDDEGDDSDNDDDDDDDSELQLGGTAASGSRPLTRPGSTRNVQPMAMADDQLSFGSSDEAAGELATGVKLLQQQKKLPQPQTQQRSSSGREQEKGTTFELTPDKWEQLPLQPELKELFPYILKYTPQTIDTPYHLQPFVPEFVPAVGDVDAMLKVQAPALLQPQAPRQRELDEQLQRLGLELLDEPSGAQSEPSLLNMKLRSVLSGSRAGNSRHAARSATQVPTAKTAKDIEKWIAEVEQVHMTQSMYDAQPRKDIDALLENWPRSFGTPASKEAVDEAYRACLQQQISLVDYVRTLCEHFGVEGPLETQSDYIHNIQTLFALYLAASQAWE
ncbi:intraflagellar transport protein 46 homolog [Drosophila mojavensis]|uniref:intraflagellar transport protein 46 homolog n=1 Tax=Drosophila mojavensis TaxID=7230 RepID=UPI001CD0D953|nr:intraflagellar transport protein 46 homolog [Drosophila mojavensis]